MSERWAVVLGASSGSGAAIARSVAHKHRFHVYGAHRGNHPEAAAAVEEEVRALGLRTHFHVGDAGNAEAAEEGARRLREVAGPGSVQLFVHSLASASVGRLASVGEGEARLAPRQLARTFEVMAHSFVYWAQALLERDLLAPGALLLGLSNPMVDTTVRNTAAVAASKAALDVYVRHLARELGPLGHRVNLLKFGAVLTPAFRRTFAGAAANPVAAARGEAQLDHMREVLHRVVPAGRLLTLDEVGAVAAWLAGPEAAFMNGATVDLTGGESQHLFDALLYPKR